MVAQFFILNTMISNNGIDILFSKKALSSVLDNVFLKGLSGQKPPDFQYPLLLHAHLTCYSSYLSITVPFKT